MNDSVAHKFQKIGARIEHRERPLRQGLPFSLGIATDRHGEKFEAVSAPASDIEMWVPEVLASTRHLIIHIAQSRPAAARHAFLCGFDERHWFVSGIAGEITSVRQALEALKPTQVIDALAAHHVKAKDRNRRANAAFKRQGEWFFLAAPDFVPAGALLFRNEPLRLGRRKPHVARELARRGGIAVHVSRDYPNGLTEGEYLRLLRAQPRLAKAHWLPMMRDAEVFVRGTIRHPDHRTLHLPGWHRVWSNRESALESVAFLD